MRSVSLAFSNDFGKALMKKINRSNMGAGRNFPKRGINDAQMANTHKKKY